MVLLFARRVNENDDSTRSDDSRYLLGKSRQSERSVFGRDKIRYMIGDRNVVSILAREVAINRVGYTGVVDAGCGCSGSISYIDRTLVISFTEKINMVFRRGNVLSMDTRALIL